MKIVYYYRIIFFILISYNSKQFLEFLMDNLTDKICQDNYLRISGIFNS